VASGGQVAFSVSATDTLSHALTYAWQASCPALGGNGSFANGTSASPTWTAPANATGATQTCTVSVTASDGQGNTANGSVAQRVASVPDAVTITSAPSGTPNPVASAGTVDLTVTASDSITGHVLTYAWEATCPDLAGNGSFANGTTATPIWTAPANATGTQKTCTIGVTASDGHGQSAGSSFAQQVNSVAHQVTFTAGPSGSPNPVGSSGQVDLQLTATDSILGHTLSYAWQATCATLGVHGTFSPSATVAEPTWTAPENGTGTQQICTLGVTVSDGLGQSANGSFQQFVESLSHTVNITAGPEGVPNPVGPGGAVALSVSASDSLDHVLTYAWTASCPALGGNGTFSPGPAAEDPTWQAPANSTGQAQTCVIGVTIDDGFEQTAAGNFNLIVQSDHALTITQGPAGIPNPVNSGGTTGLSVTASDSFSHVLGYAWTATCPTLPGNGSFSNGATAAPFWTAPANLTGSTQSCTIQVTVDDGVHGLTRTSSFSQSVRSPAPQLTITQQPQGAANPVASAETANLSVMATDTLGHTLSYAWSVACPGGLGGNGTLSDPSSRTPAWTAPANLTGVQQSCTITVVASDGLGQSATTSYSQAVTPSASQQTEYRYYFAEGATVNGFFATRLALLNLDASEAATVALDFQLADGSVLTHDLVVAAQARATVEVGQLGTLNPALAPLASAEFSTVVRSDRPLVADRTMTWDQSGYGSHAEAAVAEPASVWYLAEGATLGAFELYYLIQNPNPEALVNEIEVTYLLPPPAAPLVRTYSMGPSTRMNIAVHAEPGLADVEVSAVIRTPGRQARHRRARHVPLDRPLLLRRRPRERRHPRPPDPVVLCRGRHGQLLRPLHPHWQSQ
jgi:hypothetical protein